jgi:hypothetical protein
MRVILPRNRGKSKGFEGKMRLFYADFDVISLIGRSQTIGITTFFKKSYKNTPTSKKYSIIAENGKNTVLFR